jgi:protein-S-isoprenylcysteine O-methyltransferase Ste14
VLHSLVLGPLPGWLIFALWLTLVAYWTVSARAVKQVFGRWIWWREIAVRLGFFALVVLALPGARRYAPGASVPMVMAGVVLCGLGIGLAILGRASLGQNWAVATADKASAELVTTGPNA